jgi:rod shape-determining protein MreD
MRAEPPSSVFKSVDHTLASLWPPTTVVLAMLLSVQPMHIRGYTALAPAFTLMTVYHWTIYRPDLLPVWALFAIGTFQDLLSGGPPGATALLLLLAHRILLHCRQHFANRAYPFVWAGFALVAGGAVCFLWALNSLLAGALLDLRGTGFRAVLTISVFPVASFLLGRSQRALFGAG